MAHEMPYQRTVIARAGKNVSTALMRDADLVIVGDEVVKDRYDIRRRINERELEDLISESKVVTRI